MLRGCDTATPDLIWLYTGPLIITPQGDVQITWCGDQVALKIACVKKYEAEKKLIFHIKLT